MQKKFERFNIPARKCVVMPRIVVTFVFLFSSAITQANSILIPMDQLQKNHLKAYGIAFYLLQKGIEVDWLLNYRGGSFKTEYTVTVATECTVRGVTFETISDIRANEILDEIAEPQANMNVIRLEK